MKIRKALAVVLSLAMTVTLMPATAFASTAKVANVLTVKDGATANALVRVTLDDALLANTDQQLTLEVTQHGEFIKNADDDVTLKGKAEGATTAASVVVDAYNDAGKNVAVRSYTGNLEDATGYATGGIFVKATDTRDKSMDITLTYVKGTTGGVEGAAAAADTLLKDTVIYFYVNVEADGSDGDEVQVALDGDGASVIDSFSAKTIATINADGTTATVEDADTVGRGGSDGAEVTIKESTNGAVSAGEQTIKLTLPKGVTWAAVPVLSGSMVNGASAEVEVEDEGVGTRYMTVKFTAKGNPSVKEKVVFTPSINVGKDASKGDIKLKIEGKNDSDISDASGLVIAVYGDANVNILCKDADKLPEVVSGKLQDKDNDDFVVSITFEENTTDALTSGKYIDLAFNTDLVQVKNGVDINAFVGDKYAKKDYDDGNAATAIISDLDAGTTNDRSAFTVTVPADDNAAYKGTWKDDAANALTLFIPVTVSADYVGDITLTAKGNAGIDETTVTVGKAVAPISVETTLTNVVNGAQAQATANVKVTENFPGALKDGKTLTIELDNLGLTNGVVFKSKGEAKVTAGDLEIKEPKKDGTKINVVIDDESSVASTIEFSGLAVNLARTLPEGDYDLKVNGTAVVENETYDNNNFSANAVKTPYITITTAADTAQTGIVANFYLDGSKNSTYTVNGTDATMDAAAYLDSNNRTMVPIRYVAYALGLVDSDISYNTGDNTATLSGLTNVVKVTTGSNVLQASNGNVTMDTVAVNNGGRLYVPARFIAQAFGAQVAWDQAAKTVTITK